MADPSLPSPRRGEGGERSEPGEGGSANPDRQGGGTNPTHLFPDGRGSPDHPSPPRFAPLLAAGVLFAFTLYQAVGTNNLPDFFIYRAGAELGLHGRSPYDRDAIRAAVAVQFPGADTLIANCGFFLPPQAVVVFAPFAAVPYPAAKGLWAAVQGLSAAGVLLLLRTFGGRPPVSPAARFLPVFLLLNFLTIGILIVGQTTLLFVGCVAAGQWCFERNRPGLGAVLWAIPFVKPHLALPLLPLAWYLGGWKRAAAVAGVVAGMNLLGATLAGGSPLFVRDYLEFLAAGHKAVVFNQARENYEITSWNRLLYAVTRPAAGDRFLVEQTAAVTLAGYVVWFGLVAGRCRLAGARPSPAWAAAAAAAGAVVCPQVLGYEALVMLVAVPWVRELFAAGRPLRGGLAAAAIGVQLVVPFQIAQAVGFDLHRPAAAAVLAVLVLAGPVRPAR